MKKLFLILIAVLGIAMSSFAAFTKDSKALEATKSAVTTFHDDVKDIVSTLHEDTKSITSTLYGDGKDAVTALYPDVKSAVVAIGKAIGVAAEHVYTVLVKKFVVDGIVQLLPFLLGLILIGVGWYKLSGYIKTHLDKVGWGILYPIILIIISIVTFINVDYNVMVMGLINPEYGALNYILEYSKEMLK